MHDWRRREPYISGESHPGGSCDAISVPAYAKINLSLEVLGKRADGFHDLSSVMQAVDLHDSLSLRDDSGLHLECNVPSLQGAHNLAYRALSSLRPSGRGCRALLTKRIPVAAGLGGGSSDAATALLAATRLWGTHSSCSQLLTIATELGSDVPFFLFGGTALVRGRGEQVSRLDHSTARYYLLVNPGVAVSTGRIFAALPRKAWTTGASTGDLAERIRAGSNIAFGHNALRDTLFQLYPEARECYRELERISCVPTAISGSGPTVVSMFNHREQAESVAQALGTKYWSAVAASVSRSAPWSPCA